MKIGLIIMALLLTACGSDTVDKRSHGILMKYVAVGNATIDIYGISGLCLAEVINYTSTATSTIGIDTAGLLTPTEDASGEFIDLGALGLDSIKVNTLKVCGVSGRDKCTSAIIRMYTNDLGGADTGFGGFVNTTDNYAEAPVTVTGTSGDVVIGHTLSAANTLSSYTIPVADRKLILSDFTDNTQLVSFPIIVDFSNAGAGAYEMSIEIEVAVGPVP